MKPLQQTLPLALMICAGLAQAQLYRSVGPDGKVTYSDTPSATSARVESRPLASGGGDLPYELSQASRNHPVTLYTTSNCDPCDEGRKLLVQRGIPFREKTVATNDDITQLRQAGGDGNLPFLTVGRARERGLQPSAWHNALTLAGYPATSRLPKNYRSPPVEAAAPSAPPPPAVTPDQAPAEARNAAPEPVAPANPGGNAPPGFRF
jgi:glutaredoxin